MLRVMAVLKTSRKFSTCVRFSLVVVVFKSEASFRREVFIFIVFAENFVFILLFLNKKRFFLSLHVYSNILKSI